jgi:alpha/beta superfamily hydrolase
VTRKRDSGSQASVSRRLRLPCPRAVDATLDVPGEAGPADDTDGGPSACVVACPPHPQHGGSRSDARLRAVADALVERGVACLRFDYGPWDEGRGERRDAACALDWASERYDRVGLLGYSFGGAVALCTAAARIVTTADGPGTATPDAVAAVAPARGLPDGSDAVAAVGELPVPTLVVSGERDDTVDWRPVVEAARVAGHTVEGVATDHHFVGRRDRVVDLVTPFLARHLTDRER